MQSMESLDSEEDGEGVPESILPASTTGAGSDIREERTIAPRAGEEDKRVRAATGAVPPWKAKSGKSTWGRTRMSANKTNSKMRRAHFQRCMANTKPGRTSGSLKGIWQVCQETSGYWAFACLGNISTWAVTWPFSTPPTTTSPWEVTTRPR